MPIKKFQRQSFLRLTNYWNIKSIKYKKYFKIVWESWQGVSNLLEFNCNTWIDKSKFHCILMKMYEWIVCSQGKYSLSCPLQEEPGTMRDQIFLCKIQNLCIRIIYTICKTKGIYPIGNNNYQQFVPHKRATQSNSSFYRY